MHLVQARYLLEFIGSYDGCESLQVGCFVLGHIDFHMLCYLKYMSGNGCVL